MSESIAFKLDIFTREDMELRLLLGKIFKAICVMVCGKRVWLSAHTHNSGSCDRHDFDSICDLLLIFCLKYLDNFVNFLFELIYHVLFLVYA